MGTIALRIIPQRNSFEKWSNLHGHKKIVCPGTESSPKFITIPAHSDGIQHLKNHRLTRKCIVNNFMFGPWGNINTDCLHLVTILKGGMILTCSIETDAGVAVGETNLDVGGN
mmetsp:Transcript_21312/g.28039  ORF Transcript_21312/g.28039 Transcript_21312/m.28039 type:complete len:113 (-) Transcript_21312:1235-1573(-)